MSVNSWPAAMLKNTGALKITDLILSNHLYQGTTFSVFVLFPLKPLSHTVCTGTVSLPRVSVLVS